VAVQLQDTADICSFLQSNIVTDRHAAVSNPAYKAGYLTKKGRWVGNWQTRYYLLKGPLLEYYDQVRSLSRRN
jgi:RalA-binding protein 1